VSPLISYAGEGLVELFKGREITAPAKIERELAGNVV